ncbi:MAG: sugar-binding protein [Puniceicoccaceae bacterium]
MTTRLTRITKLLPFLALFATLSGLSGQDFPEADINPGTVTVDGLIDTVWDSVAEQALSVDIDQTSPEAPDFSGYWKGLWDSEHLYILMVTTDDVTVPWPGFSFWQFDMTEIFIDPDNSKGDSYDGMNDSQFIWPRNGEGQIPFTNPLGLTLPFEMEALVQGEGVVVLEVALPLADLGITPQAGTQVGLDIYMKDNDTGLASRNHQISWSPSDDEAFRNPSLLGTITLVSETGQSWYGYPVDSSGWADTGSWMRYVNVTFDPWIWVVDLATFVYIGDDSGWAYIPK